MTKRTPLARIPIGNDELVLSVDDRDRIDIRMWTDTSGVRMASANGLTIHRNDVPKLIAALQGAKRMDAA
jgi:hypothetical protein